jgi:hypothetical protein
MYVLKGVTSVVLLRYFEANMSMPRLNKKKKKKKKKKKRVVVVSSFKHTHPTVAFKNKFNHFDAYDNPQSSRPIAACWLDVCVEETKPTLTRLDRLPSSFFSLSLSAVARTDSNSDGHRPT